MFKELKYVDGLVNDETPITPPVDEDIHEKGQTYFKPKFSYEQEKEENDREMEKIMKQMQEEELSKFSDPLIEFMDDDIPNLYEFARNRKQKPEYAETDDEDREEGYLDPLRKF